MQRARLYIVEEQELFREAYRAFFPSEPTIDLVGISEDRNADRLLEELSPLNANAVLIGTKMLEPGIVEELEVLRENYPDLGLTLLSSFYDMKGIKRLREFAKKFPLASSPKSCSRVSSVSKLLFTFICSQAGLGCLWRSEMS